MIVKYSRNFLLRNFLIRSATVYVKIWDRRRTLQYITWDVQRLCWPNCNMARAIQRHTVIMTKQITDAKVPGAEAVLSITLIITHFCGLNSLARLCRPIDILLGRPPCPSAQNTSKLRCNCLRPISNAFYQWCTILPVLFSNQPHINTMSGHLVSALRGAHQYTRNRTTFCCKSLRRYPYDHGPGRSTVKYGLARRHYLAMNATNMHPLIQPPNLWPSTYVD